MKKLKLFLIAVLACAMLTGVNAAMAAVPNISDPSVVEAFVDGVVKPTMMEHHSPSGVVMVMKNGRTILAKGYGYIDVDQRIPVDPYTSMFRPGSISKLFTWVSVMQLVEQGKLDLDTDVNQYLKTFKIEDTWPGQPITLRDLMTHTPGFEEGYLGYGQIDDPSLIMPLAEALEKYQPLRINPPGTHAAYSNYGAALAGLIVSNVSGLGFNDYVKKNIFDVLGMTHSTFDEPLPADLEPFMVKGYGFNAGTDSYFENNYELNSNFGPAGALATSAYDISLFAKALLNNGSYEGSQILKPATLQQMLDEGFTHDDRVRDMGLGFMQQPFAPVDFESFGHGGANLYFISYLSMSQNENFMLFYSFSGPGARKTSSALKNTFYQEFFPADTPDIEPPAGFFERSDRFVGPYNSWRRTFSKAEANHVMYRDNPEIRALPDNTLMIGENRYVEVEKNLFRGVNNNRLVAFQENKNGDIIGFVEDGNPSQYYRTPFYETKKFSDILINLSLLIFLVVLLRLAFQWSTYRDSKGPEKRARQASVIVAFISIADFIFIQAIVTDQSAIWNGIPDTYKAALFILNLLVLAAIYHLFQSVQVWRLGLFISKWARVRYSFVTLAALAMSWYCIHWNLTGFNYFS